MSNSTKVISIHKKRSASRDRGYSWNPPARGMVRAMVVKNGKTMHIDIAN